MGIKQVYFCLQTKEEVPTNQVEQHLADNPTHHLVECIRTDAKEAGGQETPVTKLVADEEDSAIQQLIQVFNGGGNIGGGGSDHIVLTYGESLITPNDWFQLHGCADVRAGHVVPFEGTIVGMTLSYKRVKYAPQTFKMYIGPHEDWCEIFESHWFQPTHGAGTWATMGLNIRVSQGELLRARGGHLRGYFDKPVLGVIIKKG